ncbi:MAG: hypothetical protein DRJ01_06090 [Bacteroidetes bacterium]|nr:MAG: hypothetical protein DRJ01_06090 [Bacteroidota bacterium]
MVVNMNIVARIKFSSNLKNSSSAVGYYSYTNRYGQGKERHRTMKEILLANRKLKGNATAQAYTFAIRTSRHTVQKLQKSMLLANAPKKTDND